MLAPECVDVAGVEECGSQTVKVSLHSQVTRCVCQSLAWEASNRVCTLLSFWYEYDPRLFSACLLAERECCDKTGGCGVATGHSVISSCH